ncbi:ubiquitin conjugation factor E4 (UFD2) [Vairimorpha necatrix]|uniref:Ubiquitin conjugation factor E4 (UFD2) n=1 Tax=Vairimorpha necatrix TaxID=6039 RepID=A0AAX4JFD1_9MICR
MTNSNNMSQSKIYLSRVDFFKSLDLQFDGGSSLDLEESEILFLYFIEISEDPLLTIFQNYSKDYSENHKDFLLKKIEELPFNNNSFEYLVKESSFNTLDILPNLPLSFYIPFFSYICSKKYFYFLENLLSFPQILEIFSDESIWSNPWYVLEENFIDIIYSIIKTLICQNPLLKRHFIFSIKCIIMNNQERNKTLFKKEDFMTDQEAYSLNLLINKFLETIISKKMKIPREEESFTNFIFYSKAEVFKLSFIKMIEERKMKRIEEEETEEIDKILKNIVNEKRYGEYLSDYIHTVQNEDNPNFKLICSVYLYISEFFPPDASVISFLFKYEDLKHHILRILANNPNIIKFSLMNKIIEYYNKIQKEGHKIEIRYLINIILVENNAVLKTCRQNIKAVNYLMSDFEYCLSRGLGGIKEINEITKKINLKDINIGNINSRDIGNINSRDIEDINSLLFDLKRQKQRVHTYFIFVDTCFRLLGKIINKNKDLLLVDELIEIFVKILNCNLKIIVGPKCSDLILKTFKDITKESLNFKPKDLLRNILLIYLNIKDQKFIKKVCNEEMYFDLNLFVRGEEICRNKFLLNNSQLSELEELIEKFKENQKEQEEEEEGFYDPLTYNLIKDPIRLLTSNVTVDRSTYNMIMLNDGIDPFNRKEINESQIEEDEEVKKKIERIKNKKKY